MKLMIPQRRHGLLLVAALVAGCESTGPQGPPLVITTTSLPDATVGESYSGGINAEGGDGTYTWDVSAGSLPSGLSLPDEDFEGADAVITGVPQEEQTSTFTVRVRSGDGQQTTAEFTIDVAPAPDPLTITTLRLPPALEGQLYQVQVRITGGVEATSEWSVAEGTLPPGLSLTQEGVIEGVPTQVDTTQFTLRVTNADEEILRGFQFRVVAHRTDRFDITSFDVARIPGSIAPHVDSAIAMWETVLVGDLPFVEVPTNAFGSGGCGGFGQGVNGTTVDDVLILVNIDSIDGPGQVLGQAGPCGTRNPSGIPVLGILTLDSEDLRPLAGTNTLTDLLAHEIGHILGFGTIWDDMVDETEEGDPRFTGEQAVAQWQAAGGEGNVPVEATGGEGTAGAHWREAVFADELMTGFIEQPPADNPLSRVTVGAFEDFGYTVNLDAAESASALASLMFPDARDSEFFGDLGYDIVLRGPVRELDVGPGGGLRPNEEGRR